MLPLLLIGQGMAAMDTSIVNVAAPALRADLGISGALLQLVVAGYILAYAVFLITGARLGDDYGYRRLFVTGLAIFTVSSLACGVAPGTWLLIVGRIAQGVGAAMLVPQVMSLIQRSFEGPARARAIGYYSMILGLGSTAGQALGGVIITADFAGLSWRPAFLINVPIGIVLLARARSVLPALAGPERRKLDLVGVALLTGAMLLIVVPLTFGHDVGWPAWVWASLAAGVIGVATFLRFERALAQRGGSPLLNLDALLAAGIRPGLAVVSIGFIGYGGWLFACALYLQTGLGFSPMISGFVFAAYAFGFGISNVSWSKLPARLLRFTPAVALIAMAAANLAFGMTARHAGWVAAVMVPLLFCAGASHGLTFGTTVNQMTQRTAPQHAPALSGLVTTSVQLSIVIGVAALGAIYLAVAAPGAHAASARAIADVTCAIGALALVAIACSLRLATARAPAAAAQPA
ncbi:MFS transporter [Burkholderia ubonensis]|uniref:MFS transporter n=2 Tax=Burkholderia ubonensis TaxID=101571 RepID=A0AB74D9G8_9BURK|nr:MFS transporter [Burkholderia ubonensis]PAJ88865.1 MFS transporter [Burkholderia ubonensis]PAJ92960.1 MFS transporter [Burkholderia ubonensis]PAK01786.1 MFS transporter [Burkholderia ubonensis]PAK09500.1 MFS transporter [Burkholderia ubonensis]